MVWRPNCIFFSIYYSVKLLNAYYFGGDIKLFSKYLEKQLNYLIISSK